MKKIVASKYFKATFSVVAIITFTAIVFASGVEVGLHKARYSYQWGANYERNFEGSGRGESGSRGMRGGDRDEGPFGMMGNFGGRDFRNSHGVSGTIISTNDNTIIIKDRDGKENTIQTDDKTIIKSGRSDIKVGDLTVDQQIVVMGKPDEKGVINAQLVRVFDNNSK